MHGLPPHGPRLAPGGPSHYPKLLLVVAAQLLPVSHCSKKCGRYSRLLPSPGRIFGRMSFAAILSDTLGSMWIVVNPRGQLNVKSFWPNVNYCFVFDLIVFSV